ncbi:MAG: hypothetical protein QI199_05435 [Candidatus Korarchaeota archaeon]|nr:hypothetical protein [Candidatus Korarchaeota archaeon]
MSSEVEVEGELVFKDEDQLRSFLERLGASIEEVKEGKLDLDLDGFIVEGVKTEDGRYHLKFRGRVDWPSKLAPQGENPLDWLKTQVSGLVWDVGELKTLEIFRSSADVRFAFYSDEELERKRDEYNRWWMDSASNIVGLF